MDPGVLALTEAELKEQEERNAITELLYHSSRGNVARMKMIIAHRRVNVRLLPCSPPPCGLIHSMGGIIGVFNVDCLAFNVGSPPCTPRSTLPSSCSNMKLHCAQDIYDSLQVKSSSCSDYDRRTPL